MAEKGFKCKLTAILSAEVKGYSRLMGNEENVTLRTLTAYCSAITEIVQQYRNRVVDNPKDKFYPLAYPYRAK